MGGTSILLISTTFWLNFCSVRGNETRRPSFFVAVGNPPTRRQTGFWTRPAPVTPCLGPVHRWCRPRAHFTSNNSTKSGTGATGVLNSTALTVCGDVAFLQMETGKQERQCRALQTKYNDLNMRPGCRLGPFHLCSFICRNPIICPTIFKI